MFASEAPSGKATPYMSARDLAIANLAALPDDDFLYLVEQNLDRRAKQELWDLLLSPQVVHRTHGTLITKQVDIDSQLAQRSAEMEALRSDCLRQGETGRRTWRNANSDYREWRAKALGFRQTVVARLRDATAAKARVPLPPHPVHELAADRRVRLMETVFRLAWAIYQHHQKTRAAEITPEPHDLALWESLDKIDVATVEGVITVARMLDDVMSKPNFTPPADV